MDCYFVGGITEFIHIEHIGHQVDVEPYGEATNILLFTFGLLCSSQSLESTQQYKSLLARLAN